MTAVLTVDVVIFGGGAAGLWLLDRLRAGGYAAVLLEANALGEGQTVASQGIIHGGLKYTLTGLFNPAAGAIREMPDFWRKCLRCEEQKEAGAGPALAGTRLRSDFCYLWRTKSLAGWAGMLGARVGLQTRPQGVAPADCPAVLRDCGEVFRVEEPVIDPVSFLETLARPHQAWILKTNGADGVEFETVAGEQTKTDTPGKSKPQVKSEPPAQAGPQVKQITLRDAATGRTLVLSPQTVVLTAGEGNAALRARLGLSVDAMQTRPLHMGLARGALAPLNGHCVDGAKTRVTITSAVDAQGRVVWQIGGQIAEDGVKMGHAEFLAHLRRETAACLPALSWAGVEWSAYRVNRAEAVMSGGRRPDDITFFREGNVMTAWPTKLALAPRLAQQILEQLPPRRDGNTIQRGNDQNESGVCERTGFSDGRTGGTPMLPRVLLNALNIDDPVIRDWPRPAVARPPWERDIEWTGGN